MKPNYETGSANAREVIDEALVYLIDLLADAVGSVRESSADGNGEGVVDGETIEDWTRAFYAAQDPEIRGPRGEGAYPDLGPDAVPDALADVLERIDVAYYEADAAEIGSLELNKVVGVERALDVLGSRTRSHS